MPAVVHSPFAEPRWFDVANLRGGQVPPCMAAWLSDRGSLTRALVAACEGRFRVVVQRQGWGGMLRSERELLAIRARQTALLREVELQCEQQPWVFARTLIPVSSLHGAARRLAHLRNKPLGAVLFADSNTRRLAFQVARLTARHALFHAACAHLRKKPSELWGRRTLFSYAGKPILVNEIFLPTLPACNRAAKRQIVRS